MFACDGELGECGLFGCEAVDPEAIADERLAHGAQLASGTGAQASDRETGRG